jgi:beta-lactamase regulating signal transducer with metallopeptidase domain
MTVLLAAMDHASFQALAWSLMHFVWQGALLGGLAALILLRLPLSARARYVVGVSTLAAMLATPILTFTMLMSASQTATPAQPAAMSLPASATDLLLPPSVPAPSSTAAPPAANWMFWSLPLIVGVWLVGVACFSLRLAGGWMVARRLAKRSVRPVASDLEAMARGIADRLALHRVVTVVESSAVAVPVVVGWLKPVVLLPASALFGLPMDQIEALIAHELAHVRRRDYLVNVLQSAVETMLFYHPAVWWVSRRVRLDREFCCDDVAVGVCDRVEYAGALASLAALTCVPGPAVAATGGSLLERVQRLLAGREHEHAAPGWLAAVFVAIVAVSLAPVTIRSSAPAGQAGAGAQDAPAQTAAGGPDVFKSVDPAELKVEGTEPLKVGPAEGSRNTPGAAGATSAPEATPLQSGQPTPPPSSAADSLQDERRTEDLRRVAAERELRAAEHAVEMERLALVAETVQRESRLAIAAATAELEAVRVELERAQRMMERGLGSADDVRRQTALLRNAEARLQAAQHQANISKRELELKQRAAELQLERERAQLDASQAGDPSYVEITRQLEALERMLRTLRAATGASDLPALAEGALIEPGDVLRVEIAGEPLLPVSYAVDERGEIRLPLLGALRAQGLTAMQVGEEIARQLAGKGLKAGPSVTVSGFRGVASPR